MTQLTEAIDTNDRILHLDEVLVPASRYAYIVVGSERMVVVRGDGTDTLFVRRGMGGTSRASHADNAEVTTLAGGGGVSTEELDAAVAVGLASLVGAAPADLNTLGEISDALADDADLAGTLTAAIAAKQGAHGNLTALAGLSLIADRLPYANGAGTLALATLTAAGRALLDDADAAAQLTTLGVSAFAKTLLDDADAAAARTTLGVAATSRVLASPAGDVNLAVSGTTYDICSVVLPAGNFDVWATCEFYHAGTEAWAVALLTDAADAPFASMAHYFKNVSTNGALPMSLMGNVAGGQTIKLRALFSGTTGQVKRGDPFTGNLATRLLARSY